MGAGFFTAGFLGRAELVAARRTARDMECSLLGLENEISAMQTPLPAAMRKTAVGLVHQFFETAADMIEDEGAVEGFLKAVDKSGLGSDLAEIMTGFGAGLSACDSEGQLKNIRLCRKRVGMIACRAEEAEARLGRLYISAGTAAGFAAMIMFA